MISQPESRPVTGPSMQWPRTAEGVTELRRLLQCLICNNLLQEPVCLGGCDHAFCRVCIADTLGNGCPVCRAPVWVKELQLDEQLNNIVNLFKELEAILNDNVLFEVCFLLKKLTLSFIYIKKGTK